MGTTTTTNLALIKPDADDSIKATGPFAGWCAQNASNCDTLDALFRVTTHSYSPTWHADTTNPTLGTGGFVEGKYIRLLPRLVIGHIRIFTGTTGFNPGVGLYQISTPVAIASELDGMQDSVPIGRGFIFSNAAVANATCNVVEYDTTDKIMFLRGHAGDYWRHNSPFTLGQNDRAAFYFMYPTSAP